MGEKILSILESKNRPSLSNLLYFVGGIMEIIILISVVAPFQISSDFLDNINWSNNFSASNILVKVAVGGAIIYIIIHIICVLIKKRFTYTNNLKFKRAWICVQTIDDTIDLIASVTSFIFIATIFIQQYKTGEILVSKMAQIIYFLIAVRFLFLIIFRFYLKNRNIVEQIIKQYPDLN